MKLIFAITLAISAAAAADSGKDKSATCTACHGQQGESTNDLWPNLAGQKEAYLEKQLKSFRDGDRYDPLMSPVSHMLSDQDIKDLAAYFSNLKGGS